MTYADMHVDTARASKRLHITLWTVQILLALVFALTGAMTVTQPIEALPASLAGVPLPLVRFIGAAELLGAAGLILPAATRIAPVLTPLSGLGLALVMLLASLVHISRGEFAMVLLPVVLGALSAFVAWGRGKRAPILAP
jgi:putative oxidoreductase